MDTSPDYSLHIAPRQAAQAIDVSTTTDPRASRDSVTSAQDDTHPVGEASPSMHDDEDDEAVEATADTEDAAEDAEVVNAVPDPVADDTVTPDAAEST